MRLTLVIPSYWGRRSTEPFNSEDAVYDHPTPLDSKGTLAGALESVRLLRYDDFQVVVLAAATHPELEMEVGERVESIAAPFRDFYPVACMTHSHQKEIQRAALEKGGNDFADLISLRGYSNIRNFCLVAACLSGADAAVLFDDDQVYEDPFYLEKVSSHIGGEYRGSFVGGLAGYYVNRDASYLLPEKADWVFSEWPAVRAMNEAFGIIGGGEELTVTPWVFGGNMVIHRDLYMKVAFDPNVPRGEDIDYLINARFLGYLFFLDGSLWIRHYPPPKTAPLWRRFREDLDRFMYTREKINGQDQHVDGLNRVEVEDLNPYPGRFLGEDLEDMIFKTCVLMGLDYLARGDQLGFSECMQNVQRASGDALAGVEPLGWYLEHRKRWEGCMEFLSTSGELKEYMAGLYER